MSDEQPTTDNPFGAYISEDPNDDVIAICVDCFSQMADSVAENDPFLNAGQTSACKFCGGPVVVASASAVPGMRKRRETTGGNLV